MLARLTAEAVVVGALDLLFVILAISVLDRPQAWAGYLNSAYGVGAVLAAPVSATLVGRLLGRPILSAALLLSGALAVLAFGLGLAAMAALPVVVASRALLDVASRILMQRSVPAQLLGRIFGVLEGLTMAGLAVGALLVPALVHLGAVGLRCSGSRPCCRSRPRSAGAACSAWTPAHRCRWCRSRCCARRRCSTNCPRPRSRAWCAPSPPSRCRKAPS